MLLIFYAVMGDNMGMFHKPIFRIFLGLFFAAALQSGVSAFAQKEPVQSAPVTVYELFSSLVGGEWEGRSYAVGDGAYISSRLVSTYQLSSHSASGGQDLMTETFHRNHNVTKKSRSGDLVLLPHEPNSLLLSGHKVDLRVEIMSDGYRVFIESPAHPSWSSAWTFHFDDNFAINYVEVHIYSRSAKGEHEEIGHCEFGRVSSK